MIMMPRRALIIICALLAVACAPVSADLILNPVLVHNLTSYDFEGPSLSYSVGDSGYTVSEVRVMKINPGTTVQITVIRASGSATVGQFSYQSADLLTSHMGLSLGSGNASWDQFAPIKLNAAFRICYADNTTDSTSGLAMSDIPPFNQEDEKVAYCPISHISSDPITGIIISSGSSVHLRVSVAPYENVQSSVSNYGHAASGGYLADLISFAANVWDVVLFAISIFKFIFVDHFFAVLTLYESVILAYSAHSSRNIVIFARRVVKYNERFFTIFFKFVFGIANFLYSVIRSINPL